MNIKRVLKIVGIIIFLLIILLALYLIIIHFDGFLNKNNNMTRTELVNLLSKGKECSNYYYSPINETIIGVIDDNKTEYFIKDGIIKCVVNNKIKSWLNSNTKEYIDLIEASNGKKIAIVTSLNDENIEVNEQSQHGFDYSIISEEDTYNMNFEYMGEKQVEGRTIIIVKLWNKDGLKLNSSKYYIDKETGLIVKCVDYSNLGLIKISCNRNVKLNVVTDKDIERPDLSDYEIFE